MSVVTGIMLITGLSDEGEQPLREVQEWLANAHHGHQLKDVSDRAGGNKHPQFLAMCAGINLFHRADEFAAFVMARQWEAPENVVLILQPEEGCTKVFRPQGHGLTEPNASEAGQE